MGLERVEDDDERDEAGGEDLSRRGVEQTGRRLEYGRRSPTAVVSRMLAAGEQPLVKLLEAVVLVVISVVGDDHAVDT